MNINPKTIMSYIDFLNSIGFKVSIHDWLISDSVFHQYNHHTGEYCYFITNVCYKQKICNMKHFKILEKCTEGSFYGSCYAGVGEFIYPINCENEVIGYISVGAYCDNISKSKAHHFAEKNGISIKEIDNLSEKYLNPNIPDKEYVDSAMEPLVFMLEHYYNNLYNGNEKHLFTQVMTYITARRHTKITMEDLSEKFNYSVSTLSHMFIKNTGMTLPAYINKGRLTEAKWYLENSDVSVAELSKFLGYSSCNYFASVFRNAYGITPKKYRDQSKKNH